MKLDDGTEFENLPSGKGLRKVVHPGPVYSLAFDADGQRVATGCGTCLCDRAIFCRCAFMHVVHTGDGRLRVILSDTGAVECKVEHAQPAPRHGDNRKRLKSHESRLHHQRTPKKLHCHIDSVSFDGGDRVATGCVCTCPHTHTHACVSATHCLLKRLVLATGVRQACQVDGKLRIINVSSGTVVKTVDLHTPVLSVEFDSDGTRVATACEVRVATFLVAQSPPFSVQDGLLRLIDPNTGAVEQQHDHGAQVLSVAWAGSQVQNSSSDKALTSFGNPLLPRARRSQRAAPTGHCGSLMSSTCARLPGATCRPWTRLQLSVVFLGSQKFIVAMRITRAFFFGTKDRFEE